MVADSFVVMIKRKRAYELLCADGMTCYRPLTRKRVVSRGRRTYVTNYLLGWYLLVEMVQDWVEQFHRIIRTPGIIGILMCDERPMVARESEVQRLRASEKHGFVPLPTKMRFHPGQSVLVNDGPFRELRAKYITAKGESDSVELDFFGSMRIITLPPGQLQAA